MHVCIYIYTCLHIYTCTHVYLCLCVFHRQARIHRESEEDICNFWIFPISKYVLFYFDLLFPRVGVCIYMRLLHIFTYTCMYFRVCMCVCFTYTCFYIHIYTHIYTQTHIYTYIYICVCECVTGMREFTACADLSGGREYIQFLNILMHTCRRYRVAKTHRIP